MININRPVDLLLFYLPSSLTIDNIVLQKDWHQLRRKDDLYHIYLLSDLYNPYTSLKYEQLPQLFHVVFADLIQAFYVEESEEDLHHQKTEQYSNIVQFPKLKLKA